MTPEEVLEKCRGLIGDAMAFELWDALATALRERDALQRRVEELEASIEGMHQAFPAEAARRLAQNDYMIDGVFLADGRALNAYAEILALTPSPEDNGPTDAQVDAISRSAGYHRDVERERRYHDERNPE